MLAAYLLFSCGPDGNKAFSLREQPSKSNLLRRRAQTSTNCRDRGDDRDDFLQSFPWRICLSVSGWQYTIVKVCPLITSECLCENLSLRSRRGMSARVLN